MNNDTPLWLPFVVAGLGAIWIGGANVVAGRVAERRRGVEGDSRQGWRWGWATVAPTWLSYALIVLGVVALLVGGAVAAAA